MDHEAACRCPFQDTCPTFSDPLVSWSSREHHARGCVGQSDVYRNRHCATFRCMYLTRVMSQILPARPVPAR